eukprot:CAMPEP_0177165786 /NCGR_PEP_ID=MMETSP0367-20130122/7691_1 /TAXON_ID=447022 ORGANISM="Scrippsiella hangoei-like, Strain SHHI-4" /NCGR_SAMPLE_ID=MMETSP0367 /ASSEMBLY_ACC=CAM_ASM_000362 /LENGTH=278 /DNA_ID=CAMNT_0018611821 /DNA_START=287 /DNA_END=1123 /DNA_ORIENTATION=-
MSRQSSSQDAEDAAEEGRSRMEQIQAAMRSGEAKAAARAAREAAGEAEVYAEEGRQPQPRLTAEQEEALSRLLVQPGDDGESLAPGTDIEFELADRAAEYRIKRTLEFCPDGDLARGIIREMCLNGTVPGVRTWNAVIEALGEQGALDDALGLFSEMQTAGVAANAVTYDLLASPAMRRGEFRFVEKLYAAKANDFGGGLGAASLAILLNAYANGRPPQAELAEAAFINEMDYSKAEGIPVESAATSEVLQALRRAVGLNQTCELCWEFGVNPAGAFP